jgi:vacuolar protein sorting-associated protein 26
MNYLLGAFKPACNISITFSDGKNRKQVPMKKENGQTALVPLFHSQDTISGKVLGFLLLMDVSCSSYDLVMV